MTEIEKGKIDLINDNQVSSVSTMALAAILLYVFLSNQVVTHSFTFWLVIILTVDTFRIYAAWSFIKTKKNNRVDYDKAKSFIFTGTILSGLCWGSTAVLLLPVVDEQSITFVLFMLIAIATASTTTLSYQYHFSVIFVLLVLTPLMISLLGQEYIIDTNLVFLELMIAMLMFFLLKHAKVFYHICERMLQLRVKSHEHEAENRDKSELLAKMSHELRAPMHAILGFSEIGKNMIESAPNEKISNYFSRINKSGQHLLHLLNNLLDSSKLEAGCIELNFCANDLKNTISKALEKLKPLLGDHSLTVDIRSTCAETIVMYDDEKITQVVQNLLSNAIKFSADGMKIKIHIDEAKLHLKDAQPEDSQISAISISVQDQGAGIPDDELSEIFDKTIQSSKNKVSVYGAGPGLPICKEIIECHGGIIKARNSTSSTGAMFTFTLPRQQTVKLD